MSASVIFTKQALLALLPAGFMGSVICAAVCVAVGGAVYIGGAFILRIKEAMIIFDMAMKIIGKERKTEC